MASSTGPTDPGGEPKPRSRLGLRLMRSLVSAESYGLVLLLLVVTYALAVSLHEWWAGSVIILFQIVTVWLALRTSHARPLVRRITDVLLAIGLLVAILNLVWSADDWGFPALFVVSGMLYLIAPFSIVRNIGERPEVDLETVTGAIAAYLCIGMFFAFAYRTVAALQSGPFFGASGEGTISEDLFFSFITLTTTGYGNLVPASNPGQSMAAAEAIFGSLFLVTAVAKVVNAWQPKRMRAGAAEPPDEG